jgi:hypothetical protein
MVKQLRQCGIGLLELMLSLTVIALLLVMASQYYGTVRTNYRVHEGLGIIHAVYVASESWLQNNPTIPASPLSGFTKNGSLPSDFDPTNPSPLLNPWGGDLKAAGKDQTITITMSNVPTTDCNNLTAKLQQKLGSNIVTAFTCTAAAGLSLTLTLNVAA